MPFRLIVPEQVYREMLEQAIAEQPNECCGLLGGVVEIGSDATVPIGRVLRRYPLVNELKSAVEYRSESGSLFDAIRDMRNNQWDTLAVYHSHPASPPVPSKKDREMNWSTEVVNVIVSVQTTPPTVRAWWLTAVDHCEAEWEVISLTANS